MSPTKETNFFALVGQQLDFCGPGDDDNGNSYSLTTIESYQAQFEGVTHELASGEASPLYIYNSQAPYRICHYLPDVKLIAILRHPIDRAYSAFLHLIHQGRKQITNFAQALEQEEVRIHSHWEHIWHYKQMGFYYEQLRRYYDLFPSNQIKVYLNEALKTNPEEVMRNIFQFLEVDETVVPDLSIKHNVSHIPRNKLPPLLPEVRSQLMQTYQEDLLKLQELIQVDISHWLADR